MDNSFKASEILLKIGAVSLNPNKPYKYASGILSPVYTDCRALISFPKERGKIIKFYLDLINLKDFDVIAGTATAGIPHAAWIAEKLGLPMIYVRGSAKDHGKGNQIEGRLEKKHRVAIIEDLISTAESSVQTAKAIKKAGGESTTIFAITTYRMKKAKDNLKQNRLTLKTITTFEDTVRVAEKLNLISKEDIAIIMDWTSDPAGWGKRMGFEK